MEEGYLVFLDPMPLVEYGMSFYDGQPRDDHGRFARGKRVVVAKTTGITGKVTLKEAESILSEPVIVTDKYGHNIIFHNGILEKYRDGVGRSGKDEDRLKSLGRAILAVREHNSGIIDLTNHNPPQRQYLHKIEEMKSIVVYVETLSGYVRGFIYNSHKNADKFLEKKRGR